MKTISISKATVIEKAIVALAQCCDGAAQKDGEGFNAFDSGFGRSLADQINQGRSLTSTQHESARKMLVKYRVQLRGMGFDVEAVETIAPVRPGVWGNGDRAVAMPVEAAAIVPPEEVSGESEIDELRSGLSENQRQGFDLALQWFESGADQPSFVLRGYAGTGKSFSAQTIVRALQIANPRLRVAMCAPTHKACKVLQAFAYKAGLDVHVATLHSLLHVMPGKPDKDGKKKLERNEWSQEPSYYEFGLVVVDESSMIDDDLFQHVIREKVPTIFMGDPAQLPPVVEVEGSDEINESPVFSLATGIELTQVMRYEGAIAEYVTALRNDLKAQFPPQVRTTGNMSKHQPDAWLEEFIAKVRSGDSDYARALAWTNKRVNDINTKVRSALYPGAETYVVGETLMAKEMIKVPAGERDRIFMHSCQEGTVQGVGQKTITLGVSAFGFVKAKMYRLELETDMGDCDVVHVVHPESWSEIQAYLNKAKAEILKAPSEGRSRLWREWFELQDAFNVTMRGNTMLNRLQYAYALTIHQSQGSTFEHVFVDTPNVFGCRDVTMRNRLLYVAYSRASEHLYIAAKF